MITTNPMRMLTAAGIAFDAMEYAYDESDLSGTHAAAELGLDPDSTFKTLVLRGDKNGLFVCCIPVAGEVDLKKAAAISGNKKAEMIHVKELPVLTGYIRGGCSPIGMKKTFPTYIDETAQLFDTIAVSAGVRGADDAAVSRCPCGVHRGAIWRSCEIDVGEGIAQARHSKGYYFKKIHTVEVKRMEVKTEILTVEQQQAKLLKKMRSMDLIRTLACVLVAVVVVGMAVILVPKLSAMLNQANVVLTELTAVTEELNQVDLIGMTESITQLTQVGAESLATATDELTATMKGLQEIDFAALGESIENLNAISSGMARIFGR